MSPALNDALREAVDWVAALDGTPAGEAFTARAVALANEGARPFEVPIGAGLGPRITWTTGATAACPAPPLGPPDWLGLRIVGGRVSEKVYHAVGVGGVPGGVPPLPAELPLCLEPRLVAREGGRVEVYLRAREALPPSRLLAAANAVLAGGPPLPIRPRPAADATGLSIRWEYGVVTAVTVVVWGRALPDEPTLEALVRATLPDRERAVWERVIALQPAMGIPLTRRHHALTFTRGGGGEWVLADCLAVRGQPLSRRCAPPSPGAARDTLPQPDATPAQSRRWS